MKHLLLILALFVGNSFADKPSANFYLNCQDKFSNSLNIFKSSAKRKSLAEYDYILDALLWTEYYQENREQHWREIFLPYRNTNIDFHIFSTGRDKSGSYQTIEINRKNLSIRGSTWSHECKLISETKYLEIYYEHKNQKVLPNSEFEGKNKI